MRRTPLTIAACALAGLAGAGLAAVEISGAVGDGAVDESVVRDHVHKVIVDAQDGNITLVPATAGVHVRVRRDHLINSPDTTQGLADGVLTLRTRCPLGFVRCRSDYRLGIPPGVTVTIDKLSGRVDARALGGSMTELSEEADRLSIAAR
jgi:hypothetical protein